MLDYTSSKSREAYSEIEVVVNLKKKKFEDFKENIFKLYAPPQRLFLFFLILTGLEIFGVTSSPYYHGDIVTFFIILFILIYANVLNWLGFWMFFKFLHISSMFGKTIPLRIDPFNPDHLGGLSSISELSTIAIFTLSSISSIIVPLWYIFSIPFAILFVTLTSIIIPIFFFFSMHGIYNTLKIEKQKLLKEFDDEFLLTSQKIREFISLEHKEDFKMEEFRTIAQTLSSLDIIYNRIKLMKTFPMNISILLRILLSIVLPIITILLEFIFSMIL